MTTPDTLDPWQPMRARVRATIAADLERERATAEALREQVQPRLRQAVADARADGIVTGRVWLIGSFAWGQPTAASDVDLLVEACDDRDALAARVSRRVDRDVDVVPLGQADPALVPHLLREGVPL